MNSSSEPVFEDVETYCSRKRSRPVVLSLNVVSESRGNLVTGFVINCDCEAGCLKGVVCFLGKRITSGRRRK